MGKEYYIMKMVVDMKENEYKIKYVGKENCIIKVES